MAACTECSLNKRCHALAGNVEDFKRNIGCLVQRKLYRCRRIEWDSGSSAPVQTEGALLLKFRKMLPSQYRPIQEPQIPELTGSLLRNLKHSFVIAGCNVYGIKR